MTKSVFQIIISFFFSFNVAGQVKINDPISIPLASWRDSMRLTASKFCIGDTIIKSKTNLDLRIYRFMAFGDYKLIRISTLDKHNLIVDVYSLTPHKDSLLYHIKFNSWGTDLKVKELLSKFDILNLPDLNYDFVVRNSLPRVNDGNMYELEAKVGYHFTFKEFDNPEVYSKHFAEKATQANIFTEFIKGLEKILNIKISDPEL